MKLTKSQHYPVRLTRSNTIKLSIPHGNARQLFLYWDMKSCLVWASGMNNAKQLVGDSRRNFIRVAHKDIDPPKGYRKPYGHLAFDAIERIPTMRDLIHALSR